MINGEKIKSDKQGIGIKAWVPEKISTYFFYY